MSFKSVITETNSHITLNYFLVGRENLDTRHSFVFNNDLKGKRLSKRLAKAIDDGMIFAKFFIVKDINGQEYISTTIPNMRTLSKDLKNIGY